MEDIIKTLPQHSMSWLKGMFTLYKYQDFWNIRNFVEGGILAQQSFKANPSDILLCSCPKTGTTWLKALAFAIVTREKFDASTSPLLTSLPHKCVPYLETGLDQIQNNRKNPPCFPLMATHLPYTSLPESVLVSNCKIVYIYRNIKDVIVSHYHHMRGAHKIPMEDAPFEEAFKEFCDGISAGGPYWDHIIGYWKARMENPKIVLFLKYEDMKKDPTSNVRRLAEFIGYPFSIEEVNEGVVDNIVKLCSFENLSSLEVNKSGKFHVKDSEQNIPEIENQIFFRKATDGDWENYFTDEMKEKIDKLMDEKMSGTGLVLK